MAYISVVWSEESSLSQWNVVTVIPAHLCHKKLQLWWRNQGHIALAAFLTINTFHTQDVSSLDMNVFISLPFFLITAEQLQLLLFPWKRSAHVSVQTFLLTPTPHVTDYSVYRFTSSGVNSDRRFDTSETSVTTVQSRQDITLQNTLIPIKPLREPQTASSCASVV